MFYFREDEKSRLREFWGDKHTKAMAIYGRRRVGKTELVLNFLKTLKKEKHLYFQCTSFDYDACLKDFIAEVHKQLFEDAIIDSLKNFKDVFSYLDKSIDTPFVIVIDEFPFLCRKNENAVVEFQWIIDHGLGKAKVVLLGSNLSFMKNQINDQEAPLYGRFDAMMEILPFTFSEIHKLFPDFEDAMNVYAQTGGVAQYVMMFKQFNSISTATNELFFNRDGRLFQEANNLLMQELRDTASYVSILRTLSGGEKDSGQIAGKTGIDQRGVFSYLRKLIDLEIVKTVDNPLSSKKRERRYCISDQLFRFSYAFIEPNVSVITALGKKSTKNILDHHYSEHLGLVYEDIIRENCYQYAIRSKIPFMPVSTGKWWGNMMENEEWHETEVDLVAWDENNIGQVLNVV